jgi:hypothetical protein
MRLATIALVSANEDLTNLAIRLADCSRRTRAVRGAAHPEKRYM